MADRQWYNGPRKRGLVALVGGPYPSLAAAKAALRGDQAFVETHVRDVDYWTPWEAVLLRGGDHMTLREVLASGSGRPALVARR